MKEAIKEYIEYTEQEKKDLWNDATFVFDTNVFLNLYRYSNKTREQLFSSFEHFKSRIWMPYQVALEFCKDRYKVIDEANRRFDTFEEEVRKFTDTWRARLRLEDNDEDISELSGYLKNWIFAKRTSNFLVFDATEDIVFNKILELFDGKSGKEFDDKEKKCIEQEGEKRYNLKFPPGYRDNSKNANQYGDLFVWKEILNHAKEKSVDIVFVTHDQKEDWWNISSGKTIGPRIELRKEFYDKTGQRFHMYTMTSFLSHVNENKGSIVDKETIDEVKILSSNPTLINTANGGYWGVSKDKIIEIEKLKSKIKVLEAKNAKREKSINILYKKSKNGSLTSQEEIALKRNLQNYDEDIKLIEDYRTRLWQITLL